LHNKLNQRILVHRDGDHCASLNGKIMMEGTAKDLADNPDVKEFYLGMTATGRNPNERAITWKVT
jgi:hypothetical protein